MPSEKAVFKIGNETSTIIAKPFISLLLGRVTLYQKLTNRGKRCKLNLQIIAKEEGKNGALPEFWQPTK